MGPPYSVYVKTPRTPRVNLDLVVAVLRKFLYKVIKVIGSCVGYELMFDAGSVLFY